MTEKTIQMINKFQIVKIHALKKNLGWDEMTYREFLSTQFAGRTSSKQLNANEAALLIGLMEHMVGRSGAWKPNEKKYDDLKDRGALMATPKQLRLIEALWAGVSRTTGEKDRGQALNKLLNNKFGIGDIKWIKRSEVNKIVKMLKAMDKVKAPAQDEVNDHEGYVEPVWESEEEPILI